MTTLLQGMRYGLRVLWESRGLAILAVLSLWLRVAASIAIFSVVNTVSLRALPVSGPEPLVKTVASNRAAGYNTPAYLTSAERPEGFALATTSPHCLSTAVLPAVQFAPLRPGVTCFISLCAGGVVSRMNGSGISQPSTPIRYFLRSAA